MKIKYLNLIFASVAFSIIYKLDVKAQTNNPEIFSEIKKIIKQDNPAINEQFDYYFYEKKLFEEAYTKYSSMFLVNNEDKGNESYQSIDLTSVKSMNYSIPPNKDFVYIIKFQISNGSKSEVIKLSILGDYPNRKHKDGYCMYHLADKNGNFYSFITATDVNNHRYEYPENNPIKCNKNGWIIINVAKIGDKLFFIDLLEETVLHTAYLPDELKNRTLSFRPTFMLKPRTQVQVDWVGIWVTK
ncbi:MAG: hypothetical protein U0W24_20475 [Bacteroidales bacterium]